MPGALAPAAHAGRRRGPSPTTSRLLTDWRRLPYVDPGLPLELLPSRWNGVRAAELFADLGDRLSSPARTHAKTLIRGV